MFGPLIERERMNFGFGIGAPPPGISPNLSTTRFTEFNYSSQSGVQNDGTPWSKAQASRGAMMAFIFVIGGGGSGGGGRTGATATARGGGGGGGCAAQAWWMGPLFSLPEDLVVRVGQGGLSVAANTAGNAGQFTSIFERPFQEAIVPRAILISGSTNAGGGAAGTTGAGGAAGSAGGAGANTSNGGGSIGFQQYRAGIAGAAGGAIAGANGVSRTWGDTGLLVCGGAGGGTMPVSGVVDFAGGNITGLGRMPTIAGGVAGGGAGQTGWLQKTPFMASGGSGGGTNGVTGVGGAGGEGRIGCGGGGGGAGVTGGRGGRGGNGYAIIITW